MKKLFSEFREVSFKEWKNKANFDLNGKDFNENLNWNGLEGINTPPCFSADQNIKSINHTRLQNESIDFAKYFILKNDSRSINILKSFVSDDFDSIKLFVPKNFELSQIIDIKGLLSKNIKFEFEFFVEEYIKEIIKLGENIKHSKQIYLNLDVIGRIPVEGSWLISENEDFDLLKKVSNLENNIIPFTVNSTYFQNSGANTVQQITYSLATAVEYADILGKDFFNKTQYNFAIGSNFFFEIAKITVFDFLINRVKEKYGIETKNIICCESSFRNKTIYDAHSNLLRSTTEAFSALIANVDTFVSSSFDSTYNSANNFSSRLGHNQLLILKKEAYANKVDNIDEGSYYLDFIKYELADKSLAIFKLIENGGGILNQLKEGIIQRKVNESARKEQILFDKNPSSKTSSDEKMDANIRKYPFIKHKKRKTIFRLIYPKRLSEEIEKVRLKVEKGSS